MKKLTDFAKNKICKLLAPRLASLSPMLYTLEGRFSLFVSKVGDLSSPRLVADFPNLITNGGLDRIGSGDSFLNFIQVGTGNTLPTVTDTSMTNFRAATSTTTPTAPDTSICANSAPYYTEYQMSKRFAAGEATGNLAEVGVAWGAGANTLFSHALILDTGGNPTTISLANDEILDVQYTLRVNAPTVDVTATVNGYTTTTRAARVTDTNTWKAHGFSLWWGSVFSTQTLGDVTSMPSGQSYSQVTGGTVFDTYVSGTYSRTGSSTFHLDYGNAPGGIGSAFLIVGFGAWQLSFDPVIPKDNTKQLVLNWTTSWTRA